MPSTFLGRAWVFRLPRFPTQKHSVELVSCHCVGIPLYLYDPLRVMVSITCHKCLWLFCWHLSNHIPLVAHFDGFRFGATIHEIFGSPEMPWGGQPVNEETVAGCCSVEAPPTSRSEWRVFVGAKDLRYPNTPEKTAAGTSLSVMNMLSESQNKL